MPKVRKAELSLLYATRRLVLFYISAMYHQNIPKSIQVTERTRNLFQIKQRVITPKVRKSRVVNLVCDTSSRPDLHFYQVSSKYSKGYSSYKADKEFYGDANRIHLNIICLPHPLTSYFLELWHHIDEKLFVLRFYGPVNPMGSCRARSVYLTTRLLGRLSPLSS